MTNKEIAEVLEEIAEFLELKGENPFKVRAFSNGARIIDSLTKEASDLVQFGKLREIKGIGEVTASSLIKEFGSIEGIYEALEKGEKPFLDAGIKERIIKLLRENKEEAEFSKILALIRRVAQKFPQRILGTSCNSWCRS